MQRTAHTSPITARRPTTLRVACLATLATLAMLVPSAQAQAATTTSRTPVKAADVVFRLRVDGFPALRADVWRRPGLRGRPVVVLVHGGGWQAGSRTEWQRHGWAQSFAAAGYVVVVPSYRLACAVDPAKPNPLCGATMAQQRRDVVDAVRWTIRGARRWGGDPRRVVVMGGSAGAHLALLATSDPALAGRVRGVVAISPPVDLRSVGRHGLWLQHAASQSIRCNWAHCPARWAQHSPRVVLDRTRRVPPTYLFSSRRDVRVSRVDVVRMAASLRSRGVVVASREPVATSSGCHGPWACERLTVAGTRRTLRADLSHWIAAVTRPARPARHR